MDENLLWEKNSFLSCNICIEGLFEHWVFVFDKLHYSVSRLNSVLGHFSCTELSCSSVCSPQFATTVPVVSVGLFALLWPLFSGLHHKLQLNTKKSICLCCILLNDFTVVPLTLVRWRQNLLEAILLNLKQAVKIMM